MTKGQRVDATGKANNTCQRYKYDGKEYPYEGPYGKGTLSAKRNGDRETITTMKIAGGNTITQRSVVSADGKTRTTTSTGTNEQGQAVHNVVIYERQ